MVGQQQRVHRNCRSYQRLASSVVNVQSERNEQTTFKSGVFVDDGCYSCVDENKHECQSLSVRCQACQFAAKRVSELHNICINTVPEIMYALSALTMSMVWATSQHYGYAKPVLPYLKGVKHLKLTWCAQTVNLKPRCSVANSLALPMPAGPTTGLRAAAR